MIHPLSSVTLAGLPPIASGFFLLLPALVLNSLALVSSLLVPSNVSADTTRIAVASNFKPTLTKLLQSFPSEVSNQVKISSGSTGMLYAQIRHGAPFNLFFAADSSRPELLEVGGFTVTGTRKVYAIGRLVLWAPDATTPVDSNYLSTFKNVLAMANPETAPYGKAAQEFLNLLAGEHGALTESITQKFKIVLGNNVAQAFQFVTTGNAQAGIISLSQIRNSQINLEEYWLVDPSYYAPIKQQFVVLRETETGSRFIEFLQSNKARQILSDDGYLVPTEPGSP